MAPSAQPPNAEPHYRQTVVAALAARVGVIVGSIGSGSTSPCSLRAGWISRAGAGVSIGVGAGWGLWLLAFSSAALCLTASVVAVQIPAGVSARDGDDLDTDEAARWSGLLISIRPASQPGKFFAQASLRG
jgi:hypothetical protein